MYRAFPGSDYYGSSATPRRQQRTVRLPQAQRAQRAPPGRFPRSPLTGRQGRRPALPRGHRHALPQHGTRPQPPDQETDGRDGPQHKREPSTPTAHSRQFPGCCQVSGLLTLVRLLRLSALLPHPARWRRTAARSSGAAPALHHTSGLGLPLSFTRPLRRPGMGPFIPPGHMAPRGALLHLARRRTQPPAGLCEPAFRWARCCRRWRISGRRCSLPQWPRWRRPGCPPSAGQVAGIRRVVSS
jgi:hypothetical protein